MPASTPAAVRRAALLAALLLAAAPAALAQTVTLHAWGNNDNNQTIVPADLTGVVGIATGTFHSLAVKADGTVAAWGRPFEGQTDVPAGLSGVVQADGGYLHSVALKSDGTVAAWGYNLQGQTNVPAGLTDVVQVDAGGYHTLAVKADGTVAAWGFNLQGQTNVPAGLTGVVQVDAGYQHSLALKSDGTVVAWGDNDVGQTDVPAGLTDVVQIAAGELHSVALKSDGTVVAWGHDAHGQTNVPAGLTDVVQIAAGAFHTVALKADGTVVAWGVNGQGQSNVPAGLTGVAQIAASGSNHTIALSTDAPPVTAGPVDGLGDPLPEPVMVPGVGQIEVFYGGSLWNNSPDPLTVDGWPVITMPDGSLIVRRRPTVYNLAAGASVDYSGAFNVLDSFPAGAYQFTYNLGDHPSDVWSFDTFWLTKAGVVPKAGEPVASETRTAEAGGRMAARAAADLARLGDAAWVAVAPGEDVAEALGAETDSAADVPNGTALGAAYPNPFNPVATVPFTVAEAGAVRLAVYDVLGREVARLVDGFAEVGAHTAVFDASRLPSGTYLVRFEAGGQAHTQRLTLLK